MNEQWRKYELGDPWTKYPGGLLSFPSHYLSSPIPLKGLPPEIFMIVHEFYCTLNVKFSTVMQLILSGTRGRPLGFCPPCPPYCYAATKSWIRR